MKKVSAFYGEANNALLAPRGVSMHNHLLVVSDTGQNRVFIWKHFSFQHQQQADVVLGQRESNEKERNAGTGVSASSLQYPSAVWTNGEKLIVADAWNHRVLIWHTLPTQNFQPADTVVGQMDFESNLPNVMGIGKQPTAHTLNWPYGVFSNGKELWIADTGNRRVLYYHSIPETNFAGSDEVIGQDTFSNKDYDNNNAVWPYAVKIGSKNEMMIVDTQYYRVLLWHNWKEALTKKAEIIIGQKNINDNGQNQYQLKPSANTLNWVYDGCFYNNGIAIADTGNSRIVLYHQFPTQNNISADEQMGQPNFETHGETSLSMKSNIHNEMYWPFAVNTNTHLLIAADTGNHRIIFYTPSHD
jgi:hypothetical protein